MKIKMKNMCIVLAFILLSACFFPMYVFAERDSKSSDLEIETRTNDDVLKNAIDYDTEKSNCKKMIYCLTYSLDNSKTLDDLTKTKKTELEDAVEKGQELIRKKDVSIDELKALEQELRAIFDGLNMDENIRRLVIEKASATVAYENLVESVVVSTVKNKEGAQKLIDEYNRIRDKSNATADEYQLIAGAINQFIKEEQSSAIESKGEKAENNSEKKSDEKNKAKEDSKEKKTAKDKEKEKDNSPDLKPFLVMGAIVLVACGAFLVISVKKNDD